MSDLTPDQIAHLTTLRHRLHQMPELSGAEEATAAFILRELKALSPDRIWTGLGGHGVAAEFAGTDTGTGTGAGPTVLLRCELDGLPIREISDLPYRSRVDGKGHLCGHDGHMVTLLGVGMWLKAHPPKGRVILLFQPAEETGAGAKAVIEDPRWPDLRPDYAFAYHNVPGRPMGEIGLCPGPGNCASQGMQILLTGKSSHAAAPEDGLSPAPAMARLMMALPALSRGRIGEDGFALATLTHAKLGAPSFGIAPADGELRVTLRTMTNAVMEALVAHAETLVAQEQADLQAKIQWHDVFRAVTNDPHATKIARTVAQSLGHAIYDMPTPMRWSEDFGRFGDDGAQAAMLYVGSGEHTPQLHNPDYDFPDCLLPGIIAQFCGMITLCHSTAP